MLLLLLLLLLLLQFCVFISEVDDGVPPYVILNEKAKFWGECEIKLNRFVINQIHFGEWKLPSFIWRSKIGLKCKPRCPRWWWPTPPGIFRRISFRAARAASPTPWTGVAARGVWYGAGRFPDARLPRCCRNGPARNPVSRMRPWWKHGQLVQL